MSTKVEHTYTITADGTLSWRLSVRSTNNVRRTTSRCTCARETSWQTILLLLEVTADAQELKEEGGNYNEAPQGAS